MIDSHAHVHDKAYDDDRDAVVARARQAGVGEIVTVGCDLSDSARAAKVARDYGLRASIGVHPHEAKDAPSDLAAAFDELIAREAYAPVAVGETGLDYFYDHSPRGVQRAVFAQQLAYARTRGLPVIFHQRDAFDDFVAVLREHGPPPRAVVHCFTGDAGQARLLVDEFGFYLGIGGVVTFKTAEPLRDAVRAVGLERLVLETDCPYLAPVPMRGQRNEPAYVTRTAQRVAEVLACDEATVVAQTDRNARALFAL